MLNYDICQIPYKILVTRLPCGVLVRRCLIIESVRHNVYIKGKEIAGQRFRAEVVAEKTRKVFYKITGRSAPFVDSEELPIHAPLPQTLLL